MCAQIWAYVHGVLKVRKRIPAHLGHGPPFDHDLISGCGGPPWVFHGQDAPVNFPGIRHRERNLRWSDVKGTIDGSLGDEGVCI